MKKLIQRLKEPSTWAGVAVLGALFGLDANKVAAVAQIAQAIAPFVQVDGGVLAQSVIGAAAGLAVVLPESKQAAKEGA